MNKGLYVNPGLSATANAAACASLLLFPTIKVSNVYLGFKLDSCLNLLAKGTSFIVSVLGISLLTLTSCSNTNSKS